MQKAISLFLAFAMFLFLLPAHSQAADTADAPSYPSVTGGGKTIPEGDYWLVSPLGSLSRKALGTEKEQYCTEDAENISLQFNEFSPYRVFTFTYDNNGFYHITQRTTDMALTVAGDGISNGSNVTLYSYEGKATQEWSVLDAGNGTYKLQSKSSGSNLDVSDSNSNVGANIQIWPENGATAQLWRLLPMGNLSAGAGKTVEEGSYRIITAVSANKCLDIPFVGYCTTAGTNVELHSYRDDSYNVYRFTYNENGYYRITQNNTDMALTIADGSQFGYCNVVLSPYTGSVFQEWSITAGENGVYTLTSRGNSFNLDLHDGVTSDGTNIGSWGENFFDAERWKLIKVSSDVSLPSEQITSPWANTEIEKANQMNLVPDALKKADLTQPITRVEFAAVAVKVFENLSGGKAVPIVNNPFTATKDTEVLKAYGIGAVNGTSTTTFTPDALLNREQCATMLTRVFKRITLAGWTLDTDSQFNLDYKMPAKFADDAEISDYARDSVYFMAANGIINGVGNNKFAPKNTTSAQEAQGYANATREQALAIAVRMVENLK